jgi:predicted Fe-Mo cluster-binding NifX family protein
MKHADYLFMNNELIAMPLFEERISPLLDVSERFVIYEINQGKITQKAVVNINEPSERGRVLKLREIGVSLIISGAVSRYLSYIISDTGLKHIPWASGPVDEVIECYLNNTLITVRPSGGSCGGILKKRKNDAGIICGENSKKNHEGEIG